VAFLPAQEIREKSATMTVELHNLGPAALTPSAMVLNGPEAYDFIDYNGYPVTCQVGSSIPAGQSCQLTFYFTPKAAGTRRANLVIDSPQLASLAIMQISGVGAAPVVTVAEPPAAATIPTTSTEALVLLALAMAIFGGYAMRRRQR
jgi:hypothetical protein